LAPIALQLAAARERDVFTAPPHDRRTRVWTLMPEPREARSIIEDAEQAAAAGNYASAEHLLLEAAALQEQTLGPHHPDLANTLNNLGVVCEMTDNPIDAEHYFRRAHAIATATLAPDHPFVATSSKNLHDFCAARGRPVELPPSPPAVAAWLEAAAPRETPRGESSRSAKQDVAPIPRKRFPRPLALGALSAGAVLIVILTMARPWSSPVEETTSTTTAPAREAPAPTPTAPTATAPPAKPLAPPQPTAKRAEPTRSEAPTVATAQLCTALRAWRCEAANSQNPPGPMFFYTQIKSATATTIEHRWYRDDRLYRAVQLRIEANPGAGYRTYSRNTISSERAGDWRVELRTADGTVLHEERFTVR
jgi:hypothetical protein